MLAQGSIFKMHFEGERRKTTKLKQARQEGKHGKQDCVRLPSLVLYSCSSAAWHTYSQVFSRMLGAVEFKKGGDTKTFGPAKADLFSWKGGGAAEDNH